MNNICIYIYIYYINAGGGLGHLRKAQLSMVGSRPASGLHLSGLVFRFTSYHHFVDLGIQFGSMFHHFGCVF